MAVVSFVPDPGHVAPLLRLGTELRDAGHVVRAFLPSESAAVARQYPTELVELGTFDSEMAQRARASFSVFRYAIPRGAADSDLYWLALRVRASQSLKFTLEQLTTFGPDVIMADSHVFAGWYHYAAATLRTPLVLHVALGSLYAYQSAWVQRYGPLASWSLRRALRFEVERTYERALKELGGRYTRRRRDVRDAERAIDRNFPTVRKWHDFPPPGRCQVPVLLISVGMNVLERMLPGVELRMPTDVSFHAPLFPAVEPGAPPALTAFFERMRDRPIAYMSFGTMIDLDAAMCRILLRGLELAPVAAVWATGERVQRVLTRLSVPATVHVEPFVNQRAVLAERAISFAVTHAGAGGVQESLVSAKPLVCIPAHWDQFFNSAVVEGLGAGRQLQWRGLTARAFADAVYEVAANPKYRAAAERLSKVLAQAPGDDRVACIQEFVRNGAAALDGGEQKLGELNPVACRP